MSIKSFLIKQLARYISKQKNGQALKGLDYQEKIRRELVAVGQTTAYGKDHQFDKIVDYASFKQQVPLVDYEALRPYVDRINAGEENVLWKARPKYYAKTSGTTSGAKFIPLTKESIPNHFGTARNSVFNYIAQTGKADFMDGKMIFLSGSPELEKREIFCSVGFLESLTIWCPVG